MKHYVVIEDWEIDGAIRLPDEALQEMGVDVGDSLYLFEEYVDTTRCLVLSKTPRIPDRADELVGHWDSLGKIAKELQLPRAPRGLAPLGILRSIPEFAVHPAGADYRPRASRIS